MEGLGRPANSLIPEREQRTIHESEIQIGHLRQKQRSSGLIRLGGNYVVTHCIPWQVARPLLDHHLRNYVRAFPSDRRDYEGNHSRSPAALHLWSHGSDCWAGNRARP